jgi:naphthoate synthase
MGDDQQQQPFRAELWESVPGFGFTDISYHRAVDAPVVRIAFDRPEVRNAFRPRTVDELYTALEHARTSSDVGAVLLTGNGPSPKDGGWAFCSGGDQRIRGRTGYEYDDAVREDGPSTGSGRVQGGSGRVQGDSGDVEEGSGSGDPGAASADAARLGRLHILEVQRLIRFMPKAVIALVGGWAAGGGHSLHVVCDLTLASAEHARFKQTDADVGSFDAGFGSAYLARQVGQKRAREIFFLGQTYDADDGMRMGTVNRAVPHAQLEETGLEWAKIICAKSPTAQRMLKFAFNAIDDGLVGQQVFAGETTRLAYMTDEAAEGRNAFLEKRPPDWSDFPYYY